MTNLQIVEFMRSADFLTLKRGRMDESSVLLKLVAHKRAVELVHDRAVKALQVVVPDTGKRDKSHM